MNVLEIAENVCESYIPDTKRYVFSPSRIHSFAAEIRKQTLLEVADWFESAPVDYGFDARDRMLRLASKVKP